MNARRQLVVLVLLGVVLLVGLVLRVGLILSKDGVHHEEGITYLAATGHQGEYERLVVPGQGLVGTWVPADEWKRLIRPERLLVFRTIGADLAAYDVHPPLYFWLLHLWVWTFGVFVASGPLFNVPVAALTAVALFLVARHLLGDSLAACAVTAVWAVSLPVTEVSALARQYDLLTLFTVLCAWATHRFTDAARAPGTVDVALLALIVAGGALTHYHFAVVVAGGATLLALTHWRRPERKRLVLFAVAVMLGASLLVAAHPNLARSFPRQAQLAQASAKAGLSTRIDRATTTVARFFGVIPGTNAPLVQAGRGGVPLVPAALAGAALVLVLRPASRRTLIQRWREAPRTGLSALFFLAWTLGTLLLLYFTFRSPQHAMAPRYLAPVWPFLAFMPFFAFRLLWPSAAWWLTLLYCALVLLPGSVAATRPRPSLDGRAEMVRAGEVVLDNASRGGVTRLLFHLPDASRIFVDTQPELLRHPSRWADSLGVGSLYVSPVEYGSREQQQQLVRLLSERYTLKRARWPSRPAPIVYEIQGALGR